MGAHPRRHQTTVHYRKHGRSADARGELDVVIVGPIGSRPTGIREQDRHLHREGWRARQDSFYAGRCRRSILATRTEKRSDRGTGSAPRCHNGLSRLTRSAKIRSPSGRDAAPVPRRIITERDSSRAVQRIVTNASRQAHPPRRKNAATKRPATSGRRRVGKPETRTPRRSIEIVARRCHQ